MEVPAKPVEKIIDTPFGEDLEVIKNIDLNSLEKELEINLGKEVKEKLMKATTYQELVAIRENELKKHLNQQKSKGNTHSTQLVQTPKRGLERYWWVLVFLLVLKGLIIVGMTSKLIGKSKNSTKIKNINIKK